MTFVLNDLIKNVENQTGYCHSISIIIFIHVPLHNLQEIDFMCIYEDNTCLGSTQKTNTKNLGCILLKSRKKFRTKFWKWHQTVLK